MSINTIYYSTLKNRPWEYLTFNCYYAFDKTVVVDPDPFENDICVTITYMFLEKNGFIYPYRFYVDNVEVAHGTGSTSNCPEPVKPPDSKFIFSIIQFQYASEKDDDADPFDPQNLRVNVMIDYFLDPVNNLKTLFNLSLSGGTSWFGRNIGYYWSQGDLFSAMVKFWNVTTTDFADYEVDYYTPWIDISYKFWNKFNKPYERIQITDEPIEILPEIIPDKIEKEVSPLAWYPTDFPETIQLHMIFFNGHSWYIPDFFTMNVHANSIANSLGEPYSSYIYLETTGKIVKDLKQYWFPCCIGKVRCAAYGVGEHYEHKSLDLSYKQFYDIIMQSRDKFKREIGYSKYMYDFAEPKTFNYPWNLKAPAQARNLSFLVERTNRNSISKYIARYGPYAILGAARLAMISDSGKGPVGLNPDVVYDPPPLGGGPYI